MEKGHTNNPNGRPKGQPNKITSEFKAVIKQFVEHNWQQVQADFDNMDAEQRTNFIVKLLPYILPKADTTEMTDKDTFVIRLGE